MEPSTSTVIIDGDTATNLVVIIGAVITGLTSLIAAVFAGLANLKAGRAEVSSISNSAKLNTIEANTNSLSHAVTRVAQTDADARLETAKTLATLPIAPVVVTPPVVQGPPTE